MSKKLISLTPDMKQVLSYLVNLEKGISGSTNQYTLEEIAEGMKISRGKIELVAHQLSALEFVLRKERLVTKTELTKEGKTIIEKGLPENQVLGFLKNYPDGVSIGDIIKELKLSGKAINAAIGQLRREKIISIKQGIIKLEVTKCAINEELESLLFRIKENPLLIVKAKDELNILVHRGLVEQRERQETTIELTEAGKTAIKSVEVKKIISRLTPEQIRSGEWRSFNLKEYKVTSSPKFFPIGKKHPYLGFLEEVKLKLIGLGFVEMSGPLIEIEFWNFDALFQAQDHPAREWSDAYTSQNPTHGLLPKDKKLVTAVKKVHETGEPVNSRGWRYTWDPKKAAQLILRPQGTAVSARTLYNLKIPSKYFSIARCYRPDSVDATHLSEFNQLEGIVCDPSITFRDLLGILRTFAIEIAGAEKVRFKPDYYPFTSPSVELSALHPKLGYIEFGGAGIFRPEVTAPFNIGDPVIAWGLGIDRLFMVKRNINDIRDLFTQKLEWLREVPLV